MVNKHEIVCQQVDPGFEEMTEIDFVGTGKLLRLFLVFLPGITMAHDNIVTLEGGRKVEGETTALYEAAVNVMKEASHGDGVPLEYHFQSENDRMIWFAENILCGLLEGDVVSEHDGVLLRLTWNCTG